MSSEGKPILAEFWQEVSSQPSDSAEDLDPAKKFVPAEKLPPLLRVWLNVSDEEEVRVAEIGAALRDLWENYLRVMWLQEGNARTPQEWVQALIAYWADIKPGYFNKIVSHRVIRLLRHRDMVRTAVGDPVVAESIVHLARVHEWFKGPKKVTATYYRWKEKGWVHLEEVLRQVLEPSPSWPRREIPLPVDYVSRPVQEKALWSALRKYGRVAVVGMPGTGKSVLLATLWNDSRLDEFYPGGKVWVSLREQMWQGQKRGEKARQGLAAILKAMGFPHVVRWSEEKMLIYLEARLSHGLVLMIIDDVPDEEWLQCVQGIPTTKMHLVFATHREMVADAVGAAVVNVGGLSLDEALALVRKVQARRGVDSGKETTEQQAACANVLRMVEGHPLLISMLAAEVHKPEDWYRLEHDLKEREGRREFYEQAGAVRHPWATLNLLWEQLPRERRAQLAALGRIWYLSEYDDDAGRALWGVSTSRARWIWRDLCDRHWAECVGVGRYRIHTVVWDFLAYRTRSRFRVLNWIREQILWKKAMLYYPWYKGIVPFTIPLASYSPSRLGLRLPHKFPPPLGREDGRRIYWTNFQYLRVLGKQPGQLPLDIDMSEIVALHRVKSASWLLIPLAGIVSVIVQRVIGGLHTIGLISSQMTTPLSFVSSVALILPIWYRLVREFDSIVWHRLAGSSLLKEVYQRRQRAEREYSPTG